MPIKPVKGTHSINTTPMLKHCSCDDFLSPTIDGWIYFDLCSRVVRDEMLFTSKGIKTVLPTLWNDAAHASRADIIIISEPRNVLLQTNTRNTLEAILSPERTAPVAHCHLLRTPAVLSFYHTDAKRLNFTTAAAAVLVYARVRPKHASM